MSDDLAPALAAWLSERLESNVSVRFHGPVPTGNSNVTMPLTATWPVGERELVLRMQVPANQIFLDADVHREFRVLDALARCGSVAVPTPRWFEADPSVLGDPFFVMDKVPGIVPTGSPTIHAAGWLHDRSPRERRVSWNSAIGAMAMVSNTDWQRDLPFLADTHGDTSLAGRLDHLRSWYEWAVGDRHYPTTDAALEWLQAEMPTDVGEVVLCWGDAWLGNTMFAADGQVSALLDWELASIGPRGIDLGWWLAFDEFTTRAHGVDRLPGFPDRLATIERYHELTGALITDIRWFEVLCAWVLTVTVIRMADIGVAAGRLASDNQMGRGNISAQMLARWLDLPVPRLDRNYAARRGLPISSE